MMQWWGDWVEAAEVRGTQTVKTDLSDLFGGSELLV